MPEEPEPGPPERGAEKEGEGEARDKPDAPPGGLDEAKSGEKNDQEARKEAEKPAEDRSAPWGDVFNEFRGNVYIEEATFGTDGGPAAGKGRGAGRVEGRIEGTEISRIVRAYAPPAGYDEALLALKDDRVIIVTGEAGSGRRAGAIAMLDQFRSPEKPLVGFSPAITVEKLAARSFDAGAGYLISDMFDEKLAPELADFHWRDVCRKVRKSKAHLVVTVGPGSIAARLDAVRSFSWQRPGPADALRAHVGVVMVADEVIDKVAEALGSRYQLTDIAEIARRITAADDVVEVLADLQETDRIAVSTWLDEVDAEIPAVLEVAALAFVVGVPERIFEAMLGELKLRIAELAPEVDTTDKDAQAEIDLRFRRLRKQRSDHRLLTVRQLPVGHGSGSLAIRHVDFRVPAYREHVVAELWNCLPGDFWAAMRRWLQDLAADNFPGLIRRIDLVNSAAVGLALLGLVAPDEVIDSYLGPWTTEDASLDEQTMAVYVVWQMSMLDQLAPLALQLAIVWAGQGSRARRRVATYAFSGALGVRFPIEAVRRLSQLADQGEPLAARAHAQLFATLAGQDADAVVVLREMRGRMKAKTSRPAAARVLNSIGELLSIRDYRSGRPAIALFLMANPRLAGEVGPLWARSLYLRPWRERAITALLHAIEAIERGREPPDDLIRSLGSAIGLELPEHERAPLRADILTRDRDARHRDQAKRDQDEDGPFRPRISEPLLEIFLRALLNPSPKELDSGHD